MMNENKLERSQSAATSPGETPSEPSTAYSYPISPLKLAQLNFGMFGSLCRLGTSKERICSVLLLSTGDFDYICELGGFQLAN
jgi:hypothetical protein